MIEVCKKLGLRDPRGWAVFVTYHNVTRSIGENERISDVLAKYEVVTAALGKQISLRFLLKKMIFLDPKNELTDPVEINLLYYQAVSDIISGKLPCTEQEARLFGATKLQHDVGDYDALRTIEDLLANLIPKNMSNIQPSSEMVSSNTI